MITAEERKHMVDSTVKKVAIFGHTGVVGSQLYKWFKVQSLKDINVVGISVGVIDGVFDYADWIFLCLPTPNKNGQQDLSAFDEVLPHIDANDECNVVIRSTVLPGTCDKIQREHPNWRVFHWPEFLSAATAWEDFIWPNTRIVGTAAKNNIVIWKEGIEALLPKTLHFSTVFTTLPTSETIKYAHNINGAMQIVFANLLYDVCNKSKANFGHLKELMPTLGYIPKNAVDSYWDVFKDGYRGYGGACFPKDIAALNTYLDCSNLLSGIIDANEWLLYAYEDNSDEEK
jgi:UDP-glucose 6-dehydrogenase